MMQGNFDGILLEKYRKLGFSIRESSDDFVHILRYGIIQATFTQFTTAEQLNDACENILNAE
jgi:hypothetical protein